MSQDRPPRRRRSLPSALRSIKGAIDLASIMVGIIVIGVIAGIIAAIVFAVIPWSQDQAAKGDLEAVGTAESVTRVQDDRYLDFPGLIGKELIEASDSVLVETDDLGSCYVAVSKSVTGNRYFTTEKQPSATLYRGDGSQSVDCGDIDLDDTMNDVGRCDIVADPTPDNHTTCVGFDFNGFKVPTEPYSMDYADLNGSTLAGSKVLALNTVIQSMNLSNADLTDTEMPVVGFMGTDFRGADLTNVTFNNFAFLNADMRGATLVNAQVPTKLGGSNFAGADFTVSQGIYPSTEFNAVDLTDADFTGMTLTDAQVLGSNADGATFKNADFKGSNYLNGSEMNDANFEDTTFEFTEIRGSDARAVSFNGAEFNGHIDLNGSDLAVSSFSDVTFGSEADLSARGVNFVSSDLAGIDLDSAASKGSGLAGSIFNFADLSGSRFRASGGLNLSDVNLQGATITGNASDAAFHRTNLKDATFAASDNWGSMSPVDLNGAQFRDADLTGADLDDTVLHGASFINTNLTGARIQSRSGTTPSLLGAAFINSNLTNAKLPPTFHSAVVDADSGSYITDSRTWTFGLYIQDSNLTGTSLDTDDVTVTAAGPTAVSFAPPKAFENADGRDIRDDSDPDKYWTGAGYDCDRESGDIFPVGTTTVSCALTFKNGHNAEDPTPAVPLDLSAANTDWSGSYITGLLQPERTPLPVDTTFGLEFGTGTVDGSHFYTSHYRYGTGYIPGANGVISSNTVTFTVTVNAG